MDTEVNPSKSERHNEMAEVKETESTNPFDVTEDDAEPTSPNNVEEDAGSTTIETQGNGEVTNASPEEQGDANSAKIQVGKQPRRVLHFSDGTLEEYSTDEEEEKDKISTASKAVDTRTMTWPKYIVYATMLAGSQTLKACDYVGEGLANFFGITTPKYQYEITEFEKMKKEEEEAKKKEDLEMSGWTETTEAAPAAVITAEQLSSGDAPVPQKERF